MITVTLYHGPLGWAVAVLACIGAVEFCGYASQSLMQRIPALGRLHAKWSDRLGEWADRTFSLVHMSAADRARWTAARDFRDLGDLTAAWLHGEIEQTPSHAGPPDEETLPHIDVLSAVNRAGFVTVGSQSGDAAVNGWPACEANVQGLASDAVLERLRSAIAGTSLVMSGARGRRTFGSMPDRWRHRLLRAFWLRRAWRDETGFYRHRCPDVSRELSAAWWVSIEDSVPGRNDALWPALAEFAGLVVAS
jgi:hypothetical protein